MKYTVCRTETADAQIRSIVLYLAKTFGNAVALEKLNQMEKQINDLSDSPYLGAEPKYLHLKRQKYRALILEKNIVFYKIGEQNKKVIIYAVVDQQRNYMDIIRGL